MNPQDMVEFWDAAYMQGDTSRSWFQYKAVQSLRLLDSSGITAADSVVDVGGGASPLVDSLIARTYLDVTVLDISSVGLHTAQNRLGINAARVQWLTADLLTWQPARTYRVWHDRAVFHFLIDNAARQQYRRVLNAATTTGAVAILATFAPDGPQRCSGLPVARYSATELATLLGERWRLIAEDREEHMTPSGTVQPFTWAAFRREHGLADPFAGGVSPVK